MTDHVLEWAENSLSLNPDSGIMALQIGPASLKGTCHAELSPGGQRIIRVQGRRAETLDREAITDAHGAGQRLRVRFAPDASGLVLRFEAAVYEAYPFLALRVGVENRGDQPFAAFSLTPLTGARLEFGSGPLDGWVNGFHSWSFSGFVPHTRRQPRTTFGPLTRPTSQNPTTRHPRRAGQYVGEEIAALVDAGRQALVAGFIGVADQFGQVYADGRPGRKSLILQTTADGVPLDPGETLWGEWAILYRIALPDPDPFGLYASAVARLTPGRVPTAPPSPGWSGWYQFFDRVTLEDMHRNQEALRDLRDRLPLRLIQLDDGYQPHWGDWLEHNDRFPDGVAGWAEAVRADGFEPGLWLSPFTVDSGSRLFHEHPEAILRNAAGRPLHGGFLITRWIKGLDPTHPVTQEFVRRTVETVVHRWGIRYLKLDFLYCAALPGVRYNPKRTRAQALRDGLRLIRDVAGEDVTLLGCGCPFGPAVGLVDIMRVSPDVAPAWYPRLFGIQPPFRRDFNLPAARNSALMSLQHAWTHRRWWWLDADNLPVREEQEMTAAGVQTLITIAGMTGSHIVLSDDLPLLPEERLRWAAALLPPLENGRLEIMELLSDELPATLIRRCDGPAGPYTLAALINWDDRPARREIRLTDLGLPDGEPTLICDFWRRRVSTHEGETLRTDPIPPHGVALLALRSLAPGAQYAGSDLHISMGGEVTRWEKRDNSLHITLWLGRTAEGTLWLRLPTPPESITCDGEPVEALPAEGDLYAVPVRIRGEATLIVRR